MSNKFLLTEWYDLDIPSALLTENIEGPLVLKNKLLQRADSRNYNGRIYPEKILAREVDKYKVVVKERRALGELDHPESAVVELKNVAILITDIWMEGKEVRGDIEVLNTPQGNIIKQLAKQNVKIGVSSRGVGSIKTENESDIVQDDFELIAFDTVSSPSTVGAFIVNESIMRGKASHDKFSDLRKYVHSILGENYFKIEKKK
jgi:hypothetical protein